MTLLSLPYPVSANRYWRTFRNRTVRSIEATAYKQCVAAIAAAAGMQPLGGPVAVRMTYHPKTTKKGVASRVRLDLSNTWKVAEDALNGIAFADDYQVVRIAAEIGAPLPGGGLTVIVEAA
jgi:crossover junction endodeoxyribonuclease RusA